MVLKNSFFYVLGDLFPSILAFFIVPFLTHSLTTSEFGILAYVSSIILFLNALTGLGFNTYIFKSFSILKYQHSNIKMIHSTFWSLLVITFSLSILFYLTLINIQISSQIEISDYAIYIVSTVFLTSITIVPMTYLRILEKAKEFVLFTVSFSIVEYFFIFILVITFNFGVEGKLLSKIIGYIFFIIVLLYFFRKILFKNFFDKKYTFDALKFGPSFAVGTLLFILIDVADRFILERYVDIKDLGLYGVAYSMAFVLMSLNKGISKALQPHIIKITKMNNIESLENTLINSKRFVNIITFTSTIIFLITIEFFIRVTFEDSYLKSIEYILWLSIVPIFYAHYNIYSSVLIAKGKKKFFIKSMAYGVISNIILNLLLIPNIGVYGAIISTILSYVIMVSVTYFEFKKITNINIPVDKSIFIFSTLLCVVIILLYYSFFNNLLIQIILTFLIFTVLLTYIYFNLKIRSKNDLAKLLQ